MELNDDQILIDEKYLCQMSNNINYPVSSLNPTSNLLLTKQQIININPYMDITSDVKSNQYVKRSLCEQFILNKINIQGKFQNEWQQPGSSETYRLNNLEIVSPVNLKKEELLGPQASDYEYNNFTSSELYKYFLSNEYNYTVPAKIIKDYRGNYCFDDNIFHGPFSLIPTISKGPSGDIFFNTTIDINKPVNISDHLAIYICDTPSNYDYGDSDPLIKTTEHGGAIILGIAKRNYTVKGSTFTDYVLLESGYELQEEQIILDIYNNANITNFVNAAVNINITLNVSDTPWNMFSGS